MRVSLDFHDFSVPNNNLFYLEQLREHYPNLKVSMFFIPADADYYKRLQPFQHEEAKKMLKRVVEEGWIELIPHGITHLFGEFKDATYKDMALALQAYDEYFNELGVPYIKGFCAPNWLISEAAIACLDDNGWWLAIDRNQPKCLKARQNYTYTWDIADPFPKRQKDIAGHGHISLPSANNLPMCIKNLMKIPSNAEFIFVSERMNHG